MQRLRVLFEQLRSGATDAAGSGCRPEPVPCADAPNVGKGSSSSVEIGRSKASSPAALQLPEKVAKVIKEQDWDKVNLIKKQAREATGKIGLEQMEFFKDGAMPRLSVFDGPFLDKGEQGPPTPDECAGLLKQAEKDGSLKPMELLPGPFQVAKTLEEKVKLLMEKSWADEYGEIHTLIADWQMKYGDNGLASNIVVPSLSPTGFALGMRFGLKSRVICADPEDAERIARIHVRKEGNFEPILYDGVIATTDNDLWREQRKHLAEAFLPLSSLAAIMPTSRARAKLCAERLAETVASSGDVVDMNDFLLHEAQAQLQLALLAVPEDVMENTNAGIRGAFLGDHRRAEEGELGRAMMEVVKNCKTRPDLALPSDGCPVVGPLSRSVTTGNFKQTADYGNLLLILFAGHDTTGHTMTWLMFELARHPDVQARLQAEVDDFFRDLAGRDPEYKDLQKLSFMDRCITETLRLWPAVASGTFRQLQFDDQIKGSGGKQVTLPKGTFVQVVNWSRHRNPDLWGPDADEFKPDRQFQGKEIAHVGCPMAAVSPQSLRFSPFAHAPRSCLGRNFAQMEMRLIIAYLLHRFTFDLSSPYEHLRGKTLGPGTSSEFRGLNKATLGPTDLTTHTEHWWGDRHYNGLKMRTTLRA